MVICGIGSVNYFKRSSMNNCNQIWNLAKLKWKLPGPTPSVGQSNWNCESVSLTGFLTSIHHLTMAEMTQDQLQHEHEACRKSALADESPPLRKHEMLCGECRQQQLYSQFEFIWHQDLLCKSKFEHVFSTFFWHVWFFVKYWTSLPIIASLEHLRTKNLGQSFCSSSQSRIRRRRIWKAKMRPSVPVEKQILRQEIRSGVLHMTNCISFFNLFIGKVHFVCVFFLVCFGLEWFVERFSQGVATCYFHSATWILRCDNLQCDHSSMWSALAEGLAAFVGNEGNEDARTLGNATRKTSCVWCCVFALIWPSHSWINACFSEFISAFNVLHLSQFHSTNTGTVISYTSAISQYWQSSWHLLEEATYLKTCQLLSWNVEQNGRKWGEFSGSTGWVGHSRSCPKAMFISLVDGIPVLKHCIHASIFPAVWVMRFNKWLCKWIWSCAMQPSAQVKKDRRFGEWHFAIKDQAESRLNTWNEFWSFSDFYQFLDCFALLLSLQKRQEDIGRRPCMPFSIWSYQPMWFLTMPLSVHVRKDITGKAPGFSTCEWSVFTKSSLCNWNHKLQSTSICMSSHAQNLTSSNVHSCQCQNCSCSELLHASSWFPFAAQWSAGVCWMGLTFEAFSPIWSASTRHWALARLDSKGFKKRTMFYDNAWYDKHKEILFGRISDLETFFVARKRVACGKPLCNVWSSTVTSMLTCWVSMQRFRPVKRPESGTGPWIKSTNCRNLDPRPIRWDLNVSRSSNDVWFVVICQFVCQLFIHLRKY